jgi:hypothetical protein
LIQAVLGCSTSRGVGPQAGQRFGPDQLTPLTVQAMAITFADDHVKRIDEVVGFLSLDGTTATRAQLNTFNLNNADASFSIAAGPNPIVSLIDLFVLVALENESFHRTAIDRTLPQEERILPESYEIPDEELALLIGDDDRALARALSLSYRDVRDLISRAFWPEQVEQLELLLEEWWEQNPARRAVSRVRLQDFSDYRLAQVQDDPSGPRNLLGLLALDPLAGMEATNREISQTRMLIDRLAFQLQRAPILLNMRAKALLYETLMTDEMVSFRETLESSGGALTQLAQVADRWPEDLALQREATIAELEVAVSRQRDELLAAINEQAEPLQNTLAQLDVTLQAADTLSGSVTETIRTFDDLSTRMHERSVEAGPTDQDPLSVAEIQQLIETAAAGVSSIERSLVTLDRLLEVDTMGEDPTRLERTVTVASAGTKNVVNYIFWRAVILAAIVLVGWVIALIIARLISARLGVRPGGKA